VGRAGRLKLPARITSWRDAPGRSCTARSRPSPGHGGHHVHSIRLFAQGVERGVETLPAWHMARGTHAAKLTHRSNGPAGWLASAATAPLTSAWPPRPLASPKAIRPTSTCSTPLAAKPPRASISSGLEFATSSALSAALPAAPLSSRLMIVPSRRHRVLPLYTRATAVALRHTLIVPRRGPGEQSTRTGTGPGGLVPLPRGRSRTFAHRVHAAGAARCAGSRGQRSSGRLRAPCSQSWCGCGPRSGAPSRLFRRCPRWVRCVLYSRAPVPP